jgi:2-aminoadipate transaminase
MPVDKSTTVTFSSLGQRAQQPTIARLMTMALENPGLLSLAAGFTDNRSLPVEFVSHCVGKLGAGGDHEHLQYGPNQGRPGLRRVLAERLHRSEPAIPAETLADALLVTNGSQQALYLAMQVLCNPGDIVLVDRPSYFVFLEMLSGLGVTARSLPLDDAGRIDRAALDRLLQRMAANGEADRLRAVYFVSYYSNPSSRSLDEREKNDLAGSLLEHGHCLPVIEDAAYRELYFDVPPDARSILSLPAWDAFPKFYTSTLTKPFATGLKVGYGVCTEPEWLRKMEYAKGHHDFGTANFSQAVLELALRDGLFDAQLGKIRPVYREKRDALHHALVQAGLGKLGWSWEVPEGGLYLWLRAPAHLDLGLEGDFCQACIAAGVVYVPGDLCFGDDAPCNFARLSFGVLQPEALAEAARRFAAVAQRFTR